MARRRYICNDGTLKYQHGNINKPWRKRKLSLLEEFFTVLVRIKMFLFELSERFDLSVCLISKTSTTWINCIMSCYNVSLFLNKNLVRKYLPRSFENYPKMRIIVDGTEIFV